MPDGGQRRQLADALQLLYQDLAFKFYLSGMIDVLPLHVRRISKPWCYPFGGSHQHFYDVSPRKRAGNLAQTGTYMLAWQGALNKNGQAVKASNRITSLCHGMRVKLYFGVFLHSFLN